MNINLLKFNLENLIKSLQNDNISIHQFTTIDGEIFTRLTRNLNCKNNYDLLPIHIANYPNEKEHSVFKSLKLESLFRKKLNDLKNNKTSDVDDLILYIENKIRIREKLFNSRMYNYNFLRFHNQ